MQHTESMKNEREKTLKTTQNMSSSFGCSFSYLCQKEKRAVMGFVVKKEERKQEKMGKKWGCKRCCAFFQEIKKKVRRRTSQNRRTRETFN